MKIPPATPCQRPNLTSRGMRLATVMPASNMARAKTPRAMSFLDVEGDLPPGAGWAGSALASATVEPSSAAF